MAGETGPGLEDTPPPTDTVVVRRLDLPDSVLEYGPIDDVPAECRQWEQEENAQQVSKAPGPFEDTREDDEDRYHSVCRTMRGPTFEV